MRGLTLIRVVSSVNRSMNELRIFMGSKGFGYVLFSTLVVVFAGAAGMLAFERARPGGEGLQDYGDAICRKERCNGSMAQIGHTVPAAA